MAKVAGGAGLNLVARLDTTRFKREKAEFEKMLKDLGISASKSNKDAFDTKSMTAYQQGMNKLKQDLLEQKKVWQDLRNEEQLAKAISAESKGAVDNLKIAEQELNNQLRQNSITLAEYNLEQKKIVDAQKLAVAAQKEADRQAGEANKRLREQLALARQQEQQRERNRRQLARESSEYYKLNQALNAVRNRAKDVLAEMFRLELQGKKNSAEYATLERRSKNLAAQTQVLDKGVKQIDNSLGLHQRHVGDYGRALDGLSPIFASINGRLALLGTSLDQLGTSEGLRGLGAQLSAMGAGLLKFLISPVGLAISAFAALFAIFQSNKGVVIDFDDKLLNVGKTTNLTGRNLVDLGNDVIELSRKLQTVSAVKLLEYATVAGQLGVKGKDDILAFSEALAKLEIATNIQGEEGGAEIARLLTLTDGGVQNVKLFGDEIVNLGNNFAATEKEILGNAEAISQNTGLYRIGRQDVLAYAVATKAVGLEAEVVGSSFNRTLATFEKSIRTGKNLDLLAKQTGMTVDELKSKFKTDASGVFNAFIKGLNDVDKSGGSVNEVLENIGIVAVRDQRVIATLATSGYDVLNRAISTVRNSSGSLTQEFDTASGKLKNQTAKFGIAWDNLVLSVENGQGIIGKSSAAVIGWFTDVVSSITPSTKSFIFNEEAVSALVDSYDKLSAKAKALGGESKLTKDEQEELRKVTAQLGELLPGVITQFDQYGNALDINRGKITEMTKAQRNLLELQNRAEIKAATDKFNKAQSYIPEATKTAQALNGSGRTLGDKVYDFIYGGDRNLESQQAAKDRITRLSATSYEAAKQLQKLGAVLTKSQKDIITYYEKQDEVIKKSGKVAKETTDETVGGVARTADVIKAEIKKLQDANKPLDLKDPLRKKNVEEIRLLKKELAEANGTAKVTDPLRAASKEYSLVSQQRAVQAEIDALTKKGREKQKTADEQELADIDAKYQKIRDKAIRFNNDPKNKAKGLSVDSGGLLLAQSNEADAVRDKQAAEKLKISIDAQKKVYDEFEQYKTKIGSDAAKERFANEIGAAESYLEYLNQQRDKLMGDDKAKGGDAGGGVNNRLQLELLDKQIEEEKALRKKADNEIYANAIIAVQTNVQKLQAIEADYQQKRKALGDKATSDQLAQLVYQRGEAIKSTNAENAYRLSGTQQLLENIDAMTRQKAIEGLNKAIAVYRDQYRQGYITAKEYYDKVGELEGNIDSLNRNNIFKTIENAIKRYKQAKKEFEEALDPDSKKDKTIAFEKAQTNLYDQISSGASSATEVINSLGSSLQELGIGGEDLQNTLKSVTGALDGIGSITKGIASGNPVDIVTGSIKLLTSAINLFNTKDKKLEKQIKAYKDQLTSLGNAYKQLERDVQNSIGESIYTDQAAQIENLREQQVLLTKARDAERDKKKSDQGKIDEYQNQIDSIPGQIEDIQKAISQNLIQTTFKDISNALADAFTDAFQAGEDGIQKMDDVFNNFIANAIKNSLKLKLIEPIIAQMTKDLTQYAQGNNNSIVGFDFSAYKESIAKAQKEFVGVLNANKEFFDTTTSTSGSSSTSNRITDAVTETTASRVEGAFNGMRMVQLQTNVLLSAQGKTLGDLYLIASNNFAIHQKIEANTRRGADAGESALPLLRSIADNTKDSLAAQLRAGGKFGY